MISSIPSRQNEELQLRRLVAQRKLYSRAKDVLAYQVILTVAFVVFCNFLVLWTSTVKVYAAFYGAMAVLLDFAGLTPWQNALKKTAAGIQELFDCDVLGLHWQEIKAGRRPDTETVTEWSRLSEPESFATLNVIDWYPAQVGQLPVPLARLVCQRTNCWWDAKLRRRYSVAVIIAVVAVFTFSVVFSLLIHATLEQFLLVGLMPFLPVFVIGARQFTDHRQAATRLDDLKNHSERLWAEGLSGEVPDDEMERRSRTLQDEIFEQRRRNALVFDWLYQRLRNEHEELMNKCAADLVKEAKVIRKTDL